MDEQRATGCSLWLMPEGALRERLAARIDALAARSRTERFPPHLTLLSGIEGRDEDVLAGARDAAEALSPFGVRLGGVAGRDEHFRCLFLLAYDDEALRAAHAAAARAFGREPQTSFLPHLSLVYGRLEPSQKRALADEAGADGACCFEARRLHAWRTEGRAPDWREIGVLELRTPRARPGS
jgi:2'-5' RNA ligase